MSICPICGEEVAPRSANKTFPFCNARCQSIDLGKWLNEEYRVPATPDEAGEGDEGANEGGGGGDGGESDTPSHHGGPGAERHSPGKPDMRH